MSNCDNKIAITGIGIVSPLGCDTASTWQALLAKKSGIGYITQFDSQYFPTTIAAEVKNFTLADYPLSKKLAKNTAPFIQFALGAAHQALEDAGIAPTTSDAERWACVVGCGMISNDFTQYWQPLADTFVTQGELDINKMGQLSHRHFFLSSEFARSQANHGLALLCQAFQIRGFASAVHTACASGGQAIGLALQTLRDGDADKVLVGGYDSMINPFGLASFSLLGALSQYNDTPESASRPFDMTRNGFVLGEGAAFLVLEKWAHAKTRGAKIYAELAGEGNTLSSYRITDSPPDGSGAWQAIAAALADAEQPMEDVDYINAHGTSTKMNDLSETAAIKRYFGKLADVIPVSSTKSQTGHLIAAAGALEVALTALALDNAVIPMTANYQQRDPDCDLDYVSEGPRREPLRAALSNSFGFGGSNSCILLREPNYAEAISGRTRK